MSATLGPLVGVEPYDETPDSVWRAALTATRAVLGAGPYVVSLLEVVCPGDLVAVWDVETLGSPSPLLEPAELDLLPTQAPHTWALVEQGRYAVGTLESYLVARLTRGTWHVSVKADLAAPAVALPEKVAAGTMVGRTEPSVFLGLDVPLRLGA
ncbi:hypothetical protein [Nocardioides sp.]|uniref:hypothetical protein n=1 Tax=Nocardioides sp. TaxID=35761 RepID=UPI003D122EDA